MRDIKFRVWNGEVMITENVVFLGKSGFAIDLDGMDWDFEFGRFGKPELIGMQYTGLKDKNGVECYEGDIIKIKYTSCTGSVSYYPLKAVTYSVGACRFNVSCANDLEVVGNIHQNPELLGN